MPALGDFGIALVRAPNPGPMTLSGTNSWVLGSQPAWIVDPGPALDAHLDALAQEVRGRGGAGGIAITHHHGDHADGVGGLLERLGTGVRVAGAAAGAATLADGESFGPLTAISLPGHATGHLGFLAATSGGLACFTGDAVLGEGSVFVAEDMAGYIDGVRRLRALGPAVLCPGHGPVVWEPAAHLDGYVAHRLEREARLVAALERGVSEEEGLLEAAWGCLPAPLRRPATLTLRAHLAKLSDEGRLPGS